MGRDGSDTTSLQQGKKPDFRVSVSGLSSNIEDGYQGLMGRLPASSDSRLTYLTVDGTRIALLNLLEQRGEYFCIDANDSSPSVLGSCLYDISNNCLIDAVFSSEYDERFCAISHMKKYEKLRPRDKKSMFTFAKLLKSSESWA